MKIYSWNMLFRNPDLDRAFDFIKHAQFDVFCLQEVPPQFLERLRTLPYNLAFALDTKRHERGKTHENYCVVLTPHPILESKPIPFPVIPTKLRAKIFRRLMWGQLNLDARGSLIVDAMLPCGRTRIFDLHLTLSYPKQILNEFELAVQAYDEGAATIICGDFNILESAHITLLNWLLGGKLSDIFAWRSTRRKFQETFARLNLQNPLRGTHTQKIALSQLDHILVPHTAKILEARMLRDRVGSDHNPMFVECELS